MVQGDFRDRHTKETHTTMTAKRPITRPTLRPPPEPPEPQLDPSYDSLIDLKEVCRRTSLGRTTIQKMIIAGTFPHRVKVTDKSTRWSANAVERWIRDRIAASKNGQSDDAD